MKTLKFKTTESSNGRATLQHPSAMVGWSDDERVLTYEVTEVPDDVPVTEVARLFNGSAIIPSDLHSVKFGQLGIGKLIK